MKCYTCHDDAVFTLPQFKIGICKHHRGELLAAALLTKALNSKVNKRKKKK